MRHFHEDAVADVAPGAWEAAVVDLVKTVLGNLQGGFSTSGLTIRAARTTLHLTVKEDTTSPSSDGRLGNSNPPSLHHSVSRLSPGKRWRRREGSRPTGDTGEPSIAGRVATG
jgi:hypothetical protein